MHPNLLLFFLITQYFCYIMWSISTIYTVPVHGYISVVLVQQHATQCHFICNPMSLHNNIIISQYRHLHVTFTKLVPEKKRKKFNILPSFSLGIFGISASQLPASCGCLVSPDILIQ